MFLDLGQVNGGVDVVYAFGIDGNWRTSFSKIVPDPTALYLGRVSSGAVQDIAAWEFFAGFDSTGAPMWERDVAAKQPVLVDERRHYPQSTTGGLVFGMSAHGFTGIAQGGVVWNPGLRRYLYSTWSEYT